MLASVRAYQCIAPFSADLLSRDEHGHWIDRTNMGIAFATEATNGEANALLARLDASISSMSPDYSMISVEIPDPGDLVRYRALVQRVKSDPLVRYVIEGRINSPALIEQLEQTRPGNAGSANMPPDQPPRNPRGCTPLRRLEGDESTLALAAVRDFKCTRIPSLLEISTDEHGQEFSRISLGIAFFETATVGELNALLASIDGGITSTIPDRMLIAVEIPDPGDLPGHWAIVEKVRANPVVQIATGGRIASPD